MCKTVDLLYICYMDILNNHHTFQLACVIACVLSFFIVAGVVATIDSLTSKNK